MRFVESLPPFDADQLRETETVVGFSLPKAYVEFLRKYNGGISPKEYVYTRMGYEGLDRFYGIGDDTESTSLIEVTKAERGFIHPAFMPIADNGSGDFVCIGVDPAIKGRVYFLYHDCWYEEVPSLTLPELVGDEVFELLAEDFTSFLSDLVGQDVVDKAES